MKKVLAVALAMCLLIPCAYAEMDMNAYLFATMYNTYAPSIFGVPALPLDVYAEGADPVSGGAMYTWQDGAYFIGVIMGPSGRVAEAFAYGMDVGADANFLARCANIMYAVAGLRSQNFSQLLHAFFMARVNPEGTECSADLAAGEKVSFFVSDGVWAFNISAR